MKVRGILSVVSLIVVVQPARAGGLFVPGSGAISTSRAGAAVASTDDGEALSINPAGLAKTDGIKLTISATLIQYFMSFTRRGTYDPITLEDRPYEGQDYVSRRERSEAAARHRQVPAAAGDRRRRGTSAAAFRASRSRRPLHAERLSVPRHDERLRVPDRSGRRLHGRAAADALRHHEAGERAAVAVDRRAYRITPDLDVGVRLTAGNLKSKTQSSCGARPATSKRTSRRTRCSPPRSATVSSRPPASASTYRIGPTIELGANWTSPVSSRRRARRRAWRARASITSREIGPVPDDEGRCARPGGTMEAQKACICLQLPMTATIGGRYKFLDESGSEIGDVELDVELGELGQDAATSTTRASSTRLHGAGSVPRADRRRPLHQRQLLHADQQHERREPRQPRPQRHVRSSARRQLRNSRSAQSKIVARGGLAYDTRAAKEGWLRANFDGAARHMTRARRRVRGFVAGRSAPALATSTRARTRTRARTPTAPTAIRPNRRSAASGDRREPSARGAPGPRSDEPAAHAGHAVRESVQPGLDQVELPDVHARLLEELVTSARRCRAAARCRRCARAS